MEKKPKSDLEKQLIVLEALLESVPTDGIPNGHLYVAFMSLLNADTYQNLLGFLKTNGGIVERHDYLEQGGSYQALLNTLKAKLKTF